MPAKFELIAPCFFGCESTAKFELTRIGAENIRVEDGRLSFCGGAEIDRCRKPQPAHRGARDAAAGTLQGRHL